MDHHSQGFDTDGGDNDEDEDDGDGCPYVWPKTGRRPNLRHHPCSSSSSSEVKQAAFSQKIPSVPPKTLPPLRNGTSITSALSSFASSFHDRRDINANPRNVASLLPPKIYGDAAEDGDFEALQRLSINYRNGCLLLDKRHSPLGYKLESAGFHNHNSFIDDDQKPAAKAFPSRSRPIFQCLEQEDDKKHRPSFMLPPLKDPPVQLNEPPPFTRVEQHLSVDHPLNDFSKILNDPQEIRRQQEILDDIRSGHTSFAVNDHAEAARIHPPRQPRHIPAHPPPTIRGSGVAATPPYHVSNSRTRSTPSTHILRRHQHPPPDARSTIASTSARQVSYTKGVRRSSTLLVDDRVARLDDGTTVRVKGTRHTFKSIAKGQATLVQCPACRTIFQLSASAKRLYCTTCEQISPMEMALMATTSTAGTVTITSDGGGGGNDSGGQLAMDDRIVCVLQRQEMEVSKMMKRSTK